MAHESDGVLNCKMFSRCSHQMIDKGTVDLEIRVLLDTIETTALLRLARILTRDMET